MCVVIFVIGSTIDAPSVGLPLILDLSLYMRYFGHHTDKNERTWLANDVCGILGMEGYLSL